MFELSSDAAPNCCRSRIRSIDDAAMCFSLHPAIGLRRASAALGGTQLLDLMGPSPTLITGACCDTPIGRDKTEKLCGAPLANMARGELHEAFL